MNCNTPKIPNRKSPSVTINDRTKYVKTASSAGAIMYFNFPTNCLSRVKDVLKASNGNLLQCWSCAGVMFGLRSNLEVVTGMLPPQI
jgi:hypothetical protein